MVARAEHGEQNRLDEKPCGKRTVASQLVAVLRRPASWAEVEEYFRWRASKAGCDEHTDEE